MRRAAVIGMGTMGPGIAATLARAGFDVATTDVSEEVRARVPGAVESAHGVLDAIGGPAAERRGSVAVHDSLPAAVEGAELVVEAVPERAEMKAAVFAELDEAAPADAILASNTSGIPITDIQQSVRDPGRVVGMHWSNPPHVIPVIELIAGEGTDPGVVERLRVLVEQMGLVPVRLKKDVPGFVENRVLYAIMRESLALVDDGVVSPEDLDSCVRWGIGFKLSVIGPIELLDVAGLDIYHAVASYLNKELSDRKDISEAVVERVRRGELGLKSGVGMYSYSPEEVPRLGAARGRKLVEVRRTLEGR
jgi:5-formyl-3-hydroxy-2-methylpyridine 4-carboxylate dehydrogenase